MEYKNILLEIDSNTAVITLNHPDKLNALNTETLKELYSAFIDLGNNNTVRSVIITGSGQKAFAAGADIKEINSLDSITGKEFSEFGQKVFSFIEHFNKPVIAAVNGFALGGGCELSLSCHIRLASENAKFGQPEINLGTIPGYGGTQRLTRLVGRGLAAELILTGEMINAEEAYRIGLANKVYPQNELLQKAKELCQKLNEKGVKAVSFSLKAVNLTDNQLVQQGQNVEAVLFGLSCGTEDFKEGTSAFLEKRKPVFNNR